ncbi:MAG: FAD-dependent oxidoreductase [Lentisphaeria bacterium]|nr:FAD-dependent oxidoreductase [Lentisphaeria bacterium]
MRSIDLSADFVVIGGGLAGMSAAVAAAREGVKTILVQDRSVPGGNASSEIRMWISGAHGEDRRETGIVEEIQLENIAKNPERNLSLWDSVLYTILQREHENLTVLYDTVCLEASMDGSRITAVKAYCSPAQTWYTISAPLFSDCSGDSALAVLAGAERRYGREARSEFGESIAPEAADRKTMGMSCLIQAQETNTPHDFTPPEWANKYTDDSMFGLRDPHVSKLSNFWWIELGGEQDALHDTGELRHELLKIAFGTWDYLKNHPDNRERYRNWALVWIGFVPGKRESYRCVGDHIMNQNDVSSGGKFPDTVAFGGWTMDDHYPAGFAAPDVEPTIFHPAPSPFGIPYRCLYSVNIDNLFFAGRNISVTHTAMSSTRVMGTCSLLGQAVGTAASLAHRYGITPREVGQKHLKELQNMLMRDDCFLPGFRYQVPEVTARAALTASTGDPAGLRGGMNRSIDGVDESWRGGAGDFVQYSWLDTVDLQEVRLVFDSDLNHREKNITALRFLDTPNLQIPSTLVRKFRLEMQTPDGAWKEIGVYDNYQRLRRIPVSGKALAVKFTILATGSGNAERIFAFDVR